MSDAGFTRRRLLQRAVAVSALGGSLAGTLGACGGGDEGPGAVDRAREAGYLRLGIANERPFGYFTESRHLTGLGPGLAQAIVAGLGIPRVVGVVSEFEGLLRGLRDGSFDVIAAGMYITPERCRLVAFGDPFYCMATALAVRRGNPRALRNLRDVAATRGTRLGVLTGSVEVADARAAGVPAHRVTELPDLLTLQDALKSGATDAVALTSLSVRRLVADSAGRLEATAPFVAGSALRCGAFAFRRENPRLREAFDRRLRDLHGSGATVRLGRRFGFTEAEMTAARDRHARDFCP